MAFDLASFKNSREYARKATTQAVTNDIVVANNAGPPTLIVPADVNRTYATIRNLHATDSMTYGYATGGVPPTLAFLLADGFELKAGEAIDLESPEAVYAVSQTANPIPIDTDLGVG